MRAGNPVLLDAWYQGRTIWGIERVIGAGTPVGRHAAPAAVDRRGDDPHRVAGDIHALFQDGGEAVLGH